MNSAYIASARMRRIAVRGLVSATVLAAVTGTLTPGAALADSGVRNGTAGVPVRSAAAEPADQAQQVADAAAAGARERVHRMALSYLPGHVRTAASNALRRTTGDAAIADFFGPQGGYEVAQTLMRDPRTVGRDFSTRVLGVHQAAFSPEVRAAADRAARGTETDRAAFMKTGYAEAQRRDRLAREADPKRRVVVTEQHRASVRALSEGDLGEQVRAAAGSALRPGATDADIAEFFGYGWAMGATLDMEAYRQRGADADVRRHHALPALIARAVSAENALRSAEDPAKARTETEQAWQVVAEHAEGARATWLAEQQVAEARASSWQKTAESAKGSTDGLWKLMAAPAANLQKSWTTERTAAGVEAGFWTDLADRARAGEIRVRG
ncbi:hypothetical protein [Streptomyces pyxinae]|uniref:hypothetical protein n=1 Tax=Streptomyces pyxinae TaxID=2970734 RepID=UPI002867FE49|nr:hypothetical protein [Streptomyces sp. LP05-1]